MKRALLIVNPKVRRLLALPLLLLVGCDDGGRARTVGGPLPQCTHAGSAVALAASLNDFPLPPGAVIDKSRMDAHGNTVVGGYVRGELDALREYFDDELPKHDYELGRGNAAGDIADRAFAGHGVAGTLTLRAIPGCDDALTVQIGLL